MPYTVLQKCLCYCYFCSYILSISVKNTKIEGFLLGFSSFSLSLSVFLLLSKDRQRTNRDLLYFIVNTQSVTRTVEPNKTLLSKYFVLINTSMTPSFGGRGTYVFCRTYVAGLKIETIKFEYIVRPLLNTF